MRFLVPLLLLPAVWLASVQTSQEAKPEKTSPAINQIDRALPLGRMPYEMTWVDREENPETLVDFEDLSGWALDQYDGASGDLRRSREQQMWGMYTGKIEYAGAREGSRVVARPPAPIPIPGRFDSIEMWGYGDRLPSFGGISAPASGATKRPPPVKLNILVLDAGGREFRFPLTDMRWTDWWLIHHKAQPQVLNDMAWPAKFAGIEVAMGAGADRRFVFVDSLAFYQEKMGPLSFKPQPRRNLKPFRGQIEGLNTGEGTLPFPTREETILPANIEPKFENRVRQTGRNRFELEYRGRDALVIYEYRPRTGTLGEITARVNRGQPFRPLDSGGIRAAGLSGGAVLSGELVSTAVRDKAVEAKFRAGAQEFEYRFQIWQKSLVLDVWCGTGDAAELSFGQVAGVRNPVPITVPYITYSHFNPRVLMFGKPIPVFASVWFDWYRSNASEPFFSAKPAVTATSAEINGGLRYVAKTDGKRNHLYERVFVTASPVYEETLPTIPNPPSLRQQEGKQVIWTVAQPDNFRKDHERSRRIRSYGLDKVMQHSHEVTWRDHNESYTMRDRAAPQKGGDKMLAWYIKAQGALGWLQGVYSNYCDFAPVNSNWNPDWVQRMPDGQWRRAWYRTYALKPAKAVEMDAYYAPRIKQKFGVTMSYTDVHTDNPPPWEYCDYDSRVPGAGTFAATYYAYGQLLINDQKIYGPTQSESTFQWLFAGLQSGGYGWVYTDVNLLTHPLDVAFRVSKIHPLECDYGMGYTNYYLSRLDTEWKKSPKKRDYVDLFLATSIGYGNMGWLVTDWWPEEPFGVEAMARSYYMMQQLQQQYAFVRPAKIAYADRSGKFVSPSQAHASGAIQDSCLHVEYENGTHVYVNRQPESNLEHERWVLKDPDGLSIELPRNGWYAYNRSNGFREFSGLVEGNRIDYVRAPEYEYLDGRGTWANRGSLGCSGAVARRAEKGGAISLIDIYGNSRIVFEAEAGGKLTAFDPDGKELGAVEAKQARDGWLEFRPVPGGRRYVYAK